MFCPACGQEALEQTNFCQFCGHPLNFTVQASVSAAAEERCKAAVVYGGFWKRFLAYWIDAIFIGIVIIGADAALGFILGLDLRPYGGTFAAVSSGVRQALGATLGFLLGTLIPWLYWSLMECSVKQATLGKMALGLIVTDLKGEPITFGRATGRYFGKFISALLLFIGFLMAGWTEKKQALHDIMAGTLVVKKQGGDETA